ncbi:MAG: 7TM diverse intracellular signaling domain-containing protein [Pseudomonadota bacterium]|nr:7TM diverse intracellular signaling domain-containing protein [Pseudomonadota bacterium]
MRYTALPRLIKQWPAGLCVLVLLLTAAVSQASPLDIRPGEAQITGRYWQYQEAPHLLDDALDDGSLSESRLLDALSEQMISDFWNHSESDFINFGFRRHAYWFRMQVRSDNDLQAYLWNHYSLLDRVVLFQCPEGSVIPQSCTRSRGGDRIPYHERIVDHPNLVLPLPLKAGETYDLYLYISTEGAYQLPLEIIDGDQLIDTMMKNNLIRGAYYAVMLAMALYNLVLFFIVRDRMYLGYSGFVLSFLFFHMNFEGSAFGYFWPQHPELNGLMMPLSFAITQFFFSMFIPRFLELKKYNYGSYMLYRIYMPVTIVFMVLSFVAPYSFAVSVQNLMNAVLAVYTLIVAIQVWRRGHEPAKLFTFAWIAFIIGVISGNVSSLGILPGNTLFLHSYQIGSVFDIVLISLAMGSRINFLNKARERDQSDLNTAQAEAIRHLTRYQDLYEHSLAARFQLNGQGRINGCNPAMAKLLGYEHSDDLIEADVHLDQFIESPEASLLLWDTLEHNGRIQGLELALMPRRGRQVYGILTMRRDTDQPDAYWVGSIIDVSEKRERDAELKRLEASRDLSLRQLVMGISHEMNTPLGNIRLANNHLQDCLLDDQNSPAQNNSDPNNSDQNDATNQQAIQQAVEHVTFNVERLAELNQLIQSSLGENTHHRPESVHMAHWLRNWKQRVQERLADHSVDIELVIGRDSAIWHGYAEVLDDVLMQLADNSAFHNPELAARGALYLRVSASVSKGVLNLHYLDNGLGVSKDLREKIFLPFYTTQRSKAKKKGLGLYQVHNRVTRLMKGSIEWPDDSTGFSITLLLPDILAARQEQDDS